MSDWIDDLLYWLGMALVIVLAYAFYTSDVGQVYLCEVAPWKPC